MAVRLNEDAEVVKTVKDGLKRTGGYCPCRLQRTEENKCICKEFREQIADPNFKGYCHCFLYYKDWEKTVDKRHIACYYTQALSNSLRIMGEWWNW